MMRRREFITLLGGRGGGVAAGGAGAAGCEGPSGRLLYCRAQRSGPKIG